MASLRELVSLLRAITPSAGTVTRGEVLKFKPVSSEGYKMDEVTGSQPRIDPMAERKKWIYPDSLRIRENFLAFCG
jgi:hypothetical protein